VAVLWAKDAEYATSAPVSMPGKVECKIHDMFGFPVPTERQLNITSFLLGRELVYITFEGASLEDAKKHLTNLFSR
jgi:hypothetical protein